VTGEEEEDAVVAVIDASSIASSGTFLAAAGAELLGPFAWLEDDHGDGATARWWWSFSVVKRIERGR
jgi:hypothetical protein